MNNLLNLQVFEHKVPDQKRKLIEEPVNEDLIKKNKYANNSEYVPESIYKRILNQISHYQWSFVPHSYEYKDGYVEYVGLLVVPGYGVHTGIGTQKLDKKQNANALAAAKTYAFKNACKEMGLAPNIGDDEWDEELFENDVQEYIEEKKKEIEKPKKKKGDKKPEKKKEEPKKKKKSIKDRVAEVRDAYELNDDDEFVGFLQIWNEDVVDLDELDDEDWEEFLEYLEENKDEFEDF